MLYAESKVPSNLNRLYSIKIYTKFPSCNIWHSALVNAAEMHRNQNKSKLNHIKHIHHSKLLNHIHHSKLPNHGKRLKSKLHMQALRTGISA